jgi:hypothetical protein
MTSVNAVPTDVQVARHADATWFGDRPRSVLALAVSSDVDTPRI